MTGEGGGSWFLFFCACLFLGGCVQGVTDVRQTMNVEKEVSRAEKMLRKVPAGSSQVLIVLESSGERGIVPVFAFERAGSGWDNVLGRMEASAGRSGFGRRGIKREGDGRTPTGIYPLVSVFGYDQSAPTRMPYRQVTEEDIWVDDAQSSDYNRWVQRGRTGASSFEDLRRSDDLYRYAVIIGYNMDPVVSGLGSAIFLHVWRGRGIPTEGCVAMAVEDVTRIIAWLDPVKKPCIVLAETQ